MPSHYQRVLTLQQSNNALYISFCWSYIGQLGNLDGSLGGSLTIVAIAIVAAAWLASDSAHAVAPIAIAISGGRLTTRLCLMVASSGAPVFTERFDGYHTPGTPGREAAA